MFERSPASGRAPGEETDSALSFVSSPGAADLRRQHALQYLARFAYPVELRTLASRVAAEEHTVPVAAVSETERERTAIKLHHIDLPALVAETAVAYDPGSRMAVHTGSDDSDRYTDATDRSRRSDVV